MAKGQRTYGPLVQEPIDRDAIIAMVRSKPRRYRIIDKPPLRPPSGPGRDHRLEFRFRETFQNLLRACPVPHKGVRAGAGDAIYAYLDASETDVAQIQAWLAPMERLVVCRDLMAVSIALDYDRQDGDPEQSHTQIAQLRKDAKPYNRPPTPSCYAAANHIAAQMFATIDQVAVFREADLVMPMPPSIPRDYDLPRLLAGQLAQRMGRGDGTTAIRTLRPHPQLKNLPVDQKLAALEGSFEIDTTAVRDRTILLVDDLYQSGISMNFVAMELQAAGARAILGLAAEKTCRNDDNAVRP